MVGIQPARKPRSNLRPIENNMTATQKKKAYLRQKRWVAANRDRNNARVRAYRRRRYLKEGCWREIGPKAIALKTWMIRLKSKPCQDCHQKFPTCCMDFDHRDGTKKKYNVGSMFAHHYSRPLIRAELKKCDLVCSNCHRIRTRNRKTGHARTKLN